MSKTVTDPLETEVINKYHKLGKDLCGYLKELDTNPGIDGLESTLKAAFEEGGKLSETIKDLNTKKKKLKEDESEYLGDKIFENKEDLTPTDKSVVERIALEVSEIKFLLDRLTELSSAAIESKNPDSNVKKALSEFSISIEQHNSSSKAPIEQHNSSPKAPISFFSTLVNLVVDTFKKVLNHLVNKKGKDKDATDIVLPKIDAPVPSVDPPPTRAPGKEWRHKVTNKIDMKNSRSR